MKILIGHTGFVGSNIVMKTKFDLLCNSKNIKEAFGTNPDLLVYSGVRAEKFLANKEPEQDYLNILSAIENIKKINPKKLVLISTIDVYRHPINVNEDTIVATKNLQPYGLNRYKLEQWVEDNVEDYLIIRLPGLFGKNLKKNFIYDLINLIPSMLTEFKFKELCNKNSFIKEFYLDQKNGFFKCRDLNSSEKEKLRDYFENIGFSALNFTDSRGIFQFYNLSNLWNHIEIALKNSLRKVNLATEPVLVSDIYKSLTGLEFVNEITEFPPKYDFRTKYAKMFNGQGEYLANKGDIIKDICQFVKGEINEVSNF